MSADSHYPEPEQDDDAPEPWMGQDEPPSKPLRPERSPLFSGLYLPKPLRAPAPECPRCDGPVEERRKDGALWCHKCQRVFYPASPSSLLFGVGLWFL